METNLVTQLNLYNRGVQQEDFYVLKNTNMPAVLTEVAFITESREERLLTNRNFDKKVALGIYNGIKQYFERY
ncbi:N-acetylmuramoyl-L-alanine amidase family protein [Sporomusa acidovorans]|uniref:N-acetylmuramoyl-L-alanine amidase AmiA n=1 Tax=Sporomusa acidovorans (strain ATCC 49682 / DSM 3132 / Mol) TaxID=1123286 RepID=A0ABZ3J4R1_SPOA4|nr:N-acetylmuramoyl-L-alanine amidase [Sporomusa acidovorans]OZC23075.1 N-acetylmuramoyl-L-alanine amidase AmiA precursor [Sporomusa acidovorans DSM 3132]SDF04578.1 N-acetylmuramoyl-L-alanine amidase [Sporomusa acidovorans]